MRTLIDLMSLRGKAALITGGAGHLGFAIGETFAEQGCNLAIMDKNAAECERMAADISERYGVRALAYPCDLESNEDLSKLPGQVFESLGSLDILVHAGALVNAVDDAHWSVKQKDQSYDIWAKALQINLTSAFTLTQASVPLMKKGGYGSVIYIGSHYGLVGPDWSFYENTDMGNAAGYAASKAGLIQLAKWYATSLAPDIRVNTISPGGIFRGHQEPFLSKYVSRTPMARMGTEEDFKGAAIFLASELSAYVTGQNIVIDGGLTAM
jgi:NAD(P)-dependent dehydrogenase (short-subunit alcohol dehydrogenase family)